MSRCVNDKCKNNPNKYELHGLLQVDIIKTVENELLKLIAER